MRCASLLASPGTEPALRARADGWLAAFRREPAAWTAALGVLSGAAGAAPPEVRLQAASLLAWKAKRQLSQLQPVERQAELAEALAALVAAPGAQGQLEEAAVRALCVALANLAIQCSAWARPLEMLGERADAGAGRWAMESWGRPRVLSSQANPDSDTLDLEGWHCPISPAFLCTPLPMLPSCAPLPPTAPARPPAEPAAHAGVPHPAATGVRGRGSSGAAGLRRARLGAQGTGPRVEPGGGGLAAQRAQQQQQQRRWRRPQLQPRRSGSRRWRAAHAGRAALLCGLGQVGVPAVCGGAACRLLCQPGGRTAVCQ